MKLTFTTLIIVFLGFLFSCTETEKMDGNTGVEIDSDYYKEKHRPQFHFSPHANWMNDPNGMVYYEGEYHLFYQYYPDSIIWGPMHWGHAVSPDMVHWEELPIGLYPDSLGYIFSGSAVIDWNNTSGLGKDNQPPMIAVFTHHNIEGERAGSNLFQYQSIAYSNDKGHTWIKYEGNPVIPNPGIKDFRDPKVIWHDESAQWVMVFAAYDKAMFYTSPNLKNWNYASEFGVPGDKRLWECPDIFPLQLEGTNDTKWILIASIQKEGPNDGTATSYFIGDFDGKTFSGNLKEQFWADYGRDNYAMVTWADIPKEDGRRLALGWMSNWQYAQIVPTVKWRSAMTLPRVLKLRNTDQGLRMVSLPVKELKSIRSDSYVLEGQAVNGKLNLNEKLDLKGKLFELELEVAVEEGKIFGIAFSNSKGETYKIGYDGTKNEFFSDRTKAGDASFSKEFAKAVHTAPRIEKDKLIKLHLFLDHASAELFADNGEVVMTDIFFPSEDFSTLQLFSEGPVELKSGRVYTLKSIWKAKK